MGKNYRTRCICSIQGFENERWNSDYYPEECLPDWRLAYFMNDFRAVFLPWRAWNESADQIGMIAGEIDDGFELILEWPPQDNSASIESTLSSLAPLAPHICAVVVASANYPQGIQDPLFSASCQAVGTLYSVHLDVSTADSAALVAEFAGWAGLVWHPGQLLEPSPRDNYLIVKLPCQNLRSIKRMLKQIKPLIDNDIRVGLFIEPAPRSAQRALEVRTLIELMGLA